MQKVSKQKLAILLLTVLLAISIALTISFASLRTNEEVNGSITFAGGLAIAISSPVAEENGITFTAQGNGLKVDFNEEAFEYATDGTDKFVLSQNAKDTLGKATVSITSNANKVFYYKVVLTQDTMDENAQIIMSSIATTSTAVPLQGSVAGAINESLTTYLSDIEVTGAITGTAEFTITFIADYIDID